MNDQNFKEITKTQKNIINIKELDISKVNAFMFSNINAMGDPGKVYFLNVNGNVYNALIKDIPIETILKSFNINIEKKHDCLDINDISFQIIKGYRWTYFYLGFENHLYMREDFYLKYGNKLFDVSLSERMKKWNVFLEKIN